MSNKQYQPEDKIWQRKDLVALVVGGVYFTERKYNIRNRNILDSYVRSCGLSDLCVPLTIT